MVKLLQFVSNKENNVVLYNIDTGEIGKFIEIDEDNNILINLKLLKNMNLDFEFKELDL